MKDKKAREAIGRLIGEVGASPHLVWSDAEPIRLLLEPPRPTAAARIRRLEAQLKELYDYLGVERVTTPQQTKLVKRRKK